MSPTPYRYAEKSVMRYIDVLRQVQGWNNPHRVSFDPTPLGVNSETAACRLRDAAHSLITGLTSHPSIDPTLLKERFQHYRVSHDGTKVFVIPKTEKKQSTPAQVEVSQEVGTDVLARVESSDHSALRAFALLLGRHLLVGQVEVVGELDHAFTTDLLITNDIELREQNPNLHIMI